MLEPPPYDTAGNVIPHDHDGILGTDYLIRGIPETQIKNGRISSGAFKSSSKDKDPHRGMSVDIAKIPSDQDYKSGKYVGAVQFLAEIPQGKDLLVGFDPKPENGAHGQIWRVDNGPKAITGGQTNAIHRSCTWHVEIDGIKIRA